MGSQQKILNESTINEMMGVNKTIKCKILVADHRKNRTDIKGSRLLIFQSLIVDH